MVITTLSTEDHAHFYLIPDICTLTISSSETQAVSRDDSITKKTMNYVTNNCPFAGLDGDMKQLYHRRDSLHVVNECLMSGDRVVVSGFPQSRVLGQFHIGHPGVKQMRSIARSHAYWPRIDQHIVDVVGKCTQCQQVVDTFSEWLELLPIMSTTTSETILTSLFFPGRTHLKLLGRASASGHEWVRRATGPFLLPASSEQTLLDISMAF